MAGSGGARVALALVLTVLVVLGTGCTPTVALTAAPGATSVACARLVVALREKPLVGLAYRYTDAQGTLAWGEPLQVSVVCGRISAPPSSRSVVIDHVQWSETQGATERGSIDRYDTYCRRPGISVSMTDLTVDPSAVLDGLADAVLRSTRTEDACTSR